MTASRRREMVSAVAPHAVAPSVSAANPIWDPQRPHPRFRQPLQPKYPLPSSGPAPGPPDANR